MSEITLWIDEREVRCEEGEYLLQVARARGIFIPAICYLSRCSPTLACKLCMVEADGKRVYACNAKTKEGMRVYTKTPEILEERRAIMQVYDINHPLECGVCDKSGECELQNYTLEMGVYTQDYSIRDSSKEKATWGQALYDPNLCIVCERCVTVCKDMVGSANLKTIKRDADAPAKELKDSMPKDAYGVWNKMSKSLIGHVGEEDCTDCGECISVCPVGALSTKHFHYKSNAWELETTWSACAHCAVGCMVGYETKQGKIYRVTNDWNFGNLCGAGRFGFDFAPLFGARERAAPRSARSLQKSRHDCL
ncbi:NADH-quinone oxidoreductase subunit 3 [Wolinella succinogenes]|uniref:2Fe-2S iron-sulfur cluster-binding protein n=1 Tax=Wolinella succinogenes TaxID=844 RepID=UPI000F71B6FA|nr:2Fe-2S iron-sulfur cluster-binding protein [Wolinella succinogenes]VEG81834.1 NADH-quinone oxidoreductase subunit 3 [Wolinella succinogenes]